MATYEEIMAVWDDVVEEFPKKSPEFCVSITAERLGCEYSDVVDALFLEGTQQ